MFTGRKSLLARRNLWPLSGQRVLQQFTHLAGAQTLFQARGAAVSGPGFAAPVTTTAAGMRVSDSRTTALDNPLAKRIFTTRINGMVVVKTVDPATSGKTVFGHHRWTSPLNCWFTDRGSHHQQISISWLKALLSPRKQLNFVFVQMASKHQGTGTSHARRQAAALSDSASKSTA